MEQRVLDADFFNRPTLTVARELLGCRLARRQNGRTIRLMITETEAYDGPEDKACHAHRGRTRRTEVLYEAPGVWYVYLCYGIHWLLNIVTGPVDYPSAVLIRGAGEISGPGRLTKSLDIGGGLNRMPATPEFDLWIEYGKRPPVAAIEATKRIGVDYAGPDWSHRPYRFILNGPT